MSVRIDTTLEGLFRTASVPAWGNLTFLGWGYRVTNTGDNESIFALWEGGGGTNLQLKANHAGSGSTAILKLNFAHDIGSAWGTGSWRRFAMTFDDSNNLLTLYEGDDDETTDLTETAQLTETGSITIHRLEIGGSAATGIPAINGRVANFKFYTAVLSLARCKTELAYFNVQDATNLWGAWALKAHTDLTDSSGNGRDLSATGTLTTEDDPPIDDAPEPSGLHAAIVDHYYRQMRG